LERRGFQDDGQYDWIIKQQQQQQEDENEETKS